MEGLQETIVIWRAETWRAIRSARILVLLALYVLFTAMSGLAVRGCAGTLERQVEAQAQQLKDSGQDPQAVEQSVEEGMGEARRQFIASFFSNNDEALTQALLLVPLALLIVYKLGLYFLPLFAALMGFDQLSGELGPRSIRYLSIRSRRSSVLLGKFLTQATLFAGLMLLVLGGLCLYNYFSDPAFGLGAMWLTLAKFWATAMVFSLPYLGLTTLFSTVVRTPSVSLVLNVMALFGLWLLDLLGGLSAQGPGSAGQLLQQLSVWHHRTDLLHPHPAQWALAAGAHLGFALVFLGAAWLVLRRRDL